MKVPAKLAAEWRARLAASGFDDIERPDGVLRDAGYELRARLRDPRAAGNAEYYRKAAQWTHVHIWPSRRLRRLWELHAEGRPESEIVRMFGPSPARHHRMVGPNLLTLRRLLHQEYRVPDPEQPTTLLDQALADFPTFDRGRRGDRGVMGPESFITARADW